MHIIGILLFFVGLLIAVIAQIYVIVLAFKFKFSAGLFCLFITPFYAFFNSDLRQEKKVHDALKVWIASLVIFVLGIFVLTIYQ